MDPATSAAITAARAAYADFGAKLDTVVALLAQQPAPAEPAPVIAPPPPVDAPVVVVPVAEPPPAGKKIDWAATGRETEARHAVTGRWEEVTVYTDGSRDGAAVSPAPAAVEPPPAPPAPVVEQPAVTPPAATLPAMEPAAGGAGLAMAQAFQRKSVFNINWERERFARFSYDASVRASYNDVGIGGIRGFMPWKPAGVQWDGKTSQFWDLAVGQAPTRDQFNRFMPNAKAIVADKKLFLMDFLDCCGMEDFTPELLPAVRAYLKAACGWVKEWNLDPAYTCFGPVNEWAGGEDANRNATYEALRFEFDAILQAELGDRYLIGMAPAYWGHHDSYTGNGNGKYNPGTNPQRIHFWHAYDRRSAADWANVQAGISAWSKANGRVVMCGEVGPGGINDGNDFAAHDGGWVEHIDRQNPALAASVPCLWACTDGDWTMNRGHDDARLWVKDKGWEPEIEAAVRRAVIANRKARGL